MILRFELYDSYNKIGERITNENSMKFRYSKVFYISGYVKPITARQPGAGNIGLKISGSREHWSENSREQGTLV